MIFSFNKLFLLALLMGVMFFVGCTADPDTEIEPTVEPTPAGLGEMTATIDGVAWKADRIVVTRHQEMMNITASTNDEQTITFSLVGKQIGSYWVGQQSVHFGAYQDGTNERAFTSMEPNATGDVRIMEINEDDMWMSGTIDFTAIRGVDNETVEIKNCEFNQIAIDEDMVALGEDNYLNVSISGSMWESSAAIGAVCGNMLTVGSVRRLDNKLVSLLLPADITTGTYNFNQDGEYVGLVNITTDSNLTSTDGQLVIDTHDTQNKMIEGSFSFSADDVEGANSKSLSNGTFHIKY